VRASASPGAVDAVHGDGCDRLSLRRDELALDQAGYGVLDGTLREAGVLGDVAEGDLDFAGGRLAVEEEIHQEGGGLAVVAAKVTHQGVDDVIVQ
jgi:hypothetical protein